jgi:hypothetical protein
MEITPLEALNLVLVLKSLAPARLHEFHTIITMNNTASQQMLEMCWGKDDILCIGTREIWFYSAAMSTGVAIIHAPGDILFLADALSRQMTCETACQTVVALCEHQALTRVTQAIDNILSYDM